MLWKVWTVKLINSVTNFYLSNFSKHSLKVRSLSIHSILSSVLFVNLTSQPEMKKSRVAQIYTDGRWMRAFQPPRNAPVHYWWRAGERLCAVLDILVLRLTIPSCEWSPCSSRSLMLYIGIQRDTLHRQQIDRSFNQPIKQFIKSKNRSVQLAQ